MHSSSFKKFDLTGKTALVTGGATGLGYEMSKALAEAGATVMLAARREVVLKQAAETLMEDPEIKTVLYHAVDLEQHKSVAALAKHAISTMGGVDIFIGNAGTETQQRIDELSDAAVNQQIRVNLTANIELTRAFLPHMRKKKWGRFIYSSSAASQLADADDLMSIYAVSKNGLNTFAKYVAAEAGADGVTANTLIIGAFHTDMAVEHFSALGEEAGQALMQSFCTMIFTQRPGMPEEVAGLVQLLASNAGSYITGSCIPIDGGLSAAFRPVKALSNN